LTAIVQFSSKHFLGQVCSILVLFLHYTHGFDLSSSSMHFLIFNPIAFAMGGGTVLPTCREVGEQVNHVITMLN